MNKWWIITIIAIVLLIVFGTIGIYIYYINYVNDKDAARAKELADEVKKVVIDDNIAETSAVENNISPNAVIGKTTYFNKCGHEIRQEEDVPTELVNKSREYVQNYYKDWEIKEFSPTKIEIKKNEDGFCGKHYKLKEHNGVIGIFNLNEQNDEIFKEDTQIQTKYLPEIDLIKLDKGIMAIGDEELNSALEDFE